jgi:hypothetical protein
VFVQSLVTFGNQIRFDAFPDPFFLLAGDAEINKISLDECEYGSSFPLMFFHKYSGLMQFFLGFIFLFISLRNCW